uniref:Uncharacterized protein n=1 Tax=viral metagenome TaxID=1070528 RepID=A0A6M3IYZ0_9ZZZZ
MITKKFKEAFLKIRRADWRHHWFPALQLFRSLKLDEQFCERKIKESAFSERGWAVVITFDDDSRVYYFVI